MKTYPHRASPELRKKQLATIHVAKAKTGMADDTYRALLQQQFNVASSADLDDAGRAWMLDHFAKLGFMSIGRTKRATNASTRPAAGCGALLDKIDALLLSHGRTRSYIEPGMVKRICKVDSLAFCTPELLRKLVAALEYDARR